MNDYIQLDIILKIEQRVEKSPRSTSVGMLTVGMEHGGDVEQHVPCTGV
jgi:hypothetical protein